MAENITTTALNNALKQVYGPRQRKQFNNTAFLWQKVKKMTGPQWRLGGQVYIGSVKKRGGASFRTLNETEELPRADSPAYGQYQVSVKTAASKYRITVQAEKASKGQEKAWVDGRIDAANMLVEQFAQRMSQMLFRSGTGAVARVNGAPGANTFVVDADMSAGSGTTFGVKYLEEQMSISASANLTGTVAEKTFDGRITDINDSTLTVTFDGPAGDLADGDYIFIGDKQRTSKNRDWMGLLGIVDDGTLVATLQNIDRTAAGNRFWRSNRTANVATADLENQFQTDADTITRRGLGVIDAIVTTFGVRKRMANDMKGDRRFIQAAESGNYTGGFDVVKWRGPQSRAIEVWVDKDCPTGTAFLLNWDALHLAWLSEPDWWDAGGGVLQRVDNTLGLEAVYFAMGNFGTDQANTHAVDLDITED